MSERFAAEEILRQAASGQIPEFNDVLVRKENGWVFTPIGGRPSAGPGSPSAPGTGAGLSLGFGDLNDFIFDFQVPLSAVKQHEASLDIRATRIFPGVFGVATPSPNGPYTFPEQMRRGIQTITAADTPYEVTDSDWHINVNISLGSVEVQLPPAITRGIAGFTDQLHIKRIGPGEGIVTLIPFGSELIDDATSAIIRARNRCFTLVSDAANWWIQ
jgi:hypothetical protein